MTYEHEGIRNPFTLPGAIHVSEKHLSESARWARQIAKKRVEHDRDRSAALAHGWELGPVEYVESEDDPEHDCRVGEWRSRILARAA